MAELTPNQIDEAAKALHLAMSVGERNPSPWETIGYRSQDRYRVMAHDAAPFLQLPWDEPTQDELQRFAHEYRNLNGTECDLTAARVALGALFERRNAALQPKPVDPRREKILDVMHTLSCIRDGEAINVRLSAKACWDVLNTVLDAAK